MCKNRWNEEIRKMLMKEVNIIYELMTENYD